jgi:hypothetical protein
MIEISKLWDRRKVSLPSTTFISCEQIKGQYKHKKVNNEFLEISLKFR